MPITMNVSIADLSVVELALSRNSPTPAYPRRDVATITRRFLAEEEEQKSQEEDNNWQYVKFNNPPRLPIEPTPLELLDQVQFDPPDSVVLALLQRRAYQEEVKNWREKEERNRIARFGSFAKSALDKGDLFHFEPDARFNLAQYRERYFPQMLSLDFYPVFEALSYLHDIDYLHRDICPQNIMIGEDNRLFLTSFGLSIEMTADASFLDRGVGSVKFWPTGFLKKLLRTRDMTEPFYYSSATDMGSFGKVIAFTRMSLLQTEFLEGCGDDDYEDIFEFWNHVLGIKKWITKFEKTVRGANKEKFEKLVNSLTF